MKLRHLKLHKEPHTILAHALSTAGRGTRQILMSWRRPQIAGKMKAKDNKGILQEFRAKMRTAEDLISKLAFSLREIQGDRSIR
jgi:hypothetical protein